MWHKVVYGKDGVTILNLFKEQINPRHFHGLIVKGEQISESFVYIHRLKKYALFYKTLNFVRSLKSQ